MIAAHGRRSGSGDRCRRTTDVAVAVAGIVALGPLMAVVAGLVRLRLGSPVLFRQRRAGLRGHEFMILKFRTMRGAAYPGQPDNARLTRLGSFLRHSSMDELPQLINVLRGEMSVIGPRPTLPEQVRHYSERQRGRLAVRPGITGWAQVLGRNALSWPDRIELDLWYIRHRNWRLDLRIVALTLRQLMRPCGVEGANGINPGFPASDRR